MRKRYCRDSRRGMHGPAPSVGVNLLAGSAAVGWGGRIPSGRPHRAGFRDDLTPRWIAFSPRNANMTFGPDVYAHDELARWSTRLLS